MDDDSSGWRTVGLLELEGRKCLVDQNTWSWFWGRVRDDLGDAGQHKDLGVPGSEVAWGLGHHGLWSASP
jgi:hypothetical protein